MMRRTPRRVEAVVSGELMRPIVELCAAGVELCRARRARRWRISSNDRALNRRRRRGRRARAAAGARR